MEAKSRFLVVDDSPTVRKHLGYLLKLVGSGDEPVSEAGSPAEALKAFRAIKPTVVFLDIMMPREQDGTATLAAILKEKPDTKIVLVTALDQSAAAVELAISRGAAAYIRKPITVRALQQVLEELEAQSGRFRRVS